MRKLEHSEECWKILFGEKNKEIADRNQDICS